MLSYVRLRSLWLYYNLSVYVNDLIWFSFVTGKPDRSRSRVDNLTKGIVRSVQLGVSHGSWEASAARYEHDYCPSLLVRPVLVGHFHLNANWDRSGNKRRLCAIRANVIVSVEINFGHDDNVFSLFDSRRRRRRFLRVISISRGVNLMHCNIF